VPANFAESLGVYSLSDARLSSQQVEDVVDFVQPTKGRR